MVVVVAVTVTVDLHMTPTPAQRPRTETTTTADTHHAGTTGGPHPLATTGIMTITGELMLSLFYKGYSSVKPRVAH